MARRRTRTRAVSVLAGSLLVLATLQAAPAQAAPTRYEAESATSSSCLVESNHAGFSGTGFVNCANTAGQFVQWTVNAANSGTATLSFGYANGGTTNRAADISVNGAVVRTGLAFNPTGAWSTWATATITATVNAGSNTIRLTGTTADGPANLDFLDFEVTSLPPPGNRFEAESGTCNGTIDSNWAGFSGTGFCNTTNAVGAALELAVTAPSAGAATLTIGYANGTTGDRPMDLRVNGVIVTEALSFPVTGAWTTWRTVTATVSLNVGTNTVRLAATTTGGGPNLDYVDVAMTAPSSDFQAENAVISQGVVESNHAGYTGSGFVNMDNAIGSYIQFTVGVAQAGEASLTIRYANGTTTSRPMDIAVNGTVVSAAHEFTGTGAWSTWATETINATLNAGNNTVRVTATTANGGPNVDKLTVGAPADTELPTKPGQPSCTDIGETELTLHWGASTDNVGVVAYDIYHLGNQISAAPGDVTSKRLTGLSPNFEYSLSVFARDAAGNTSVTSELAICKTKPIIDPNPPTAPTNLTHSNVTATSVNLSWGASSDDRGVTAYNVRNSSNTTIHTVTGTPPPTSTTVTGLQCETSYTVHVVARDQAGNTSGPSNTRTFVTGACSRGTPQPPTVIGPSNWDIPWDISWYPDGSAALITERDTFRVFKLTPGGTKTQVGTVPNSVTTDGEGGLMGLAMSPTWNGTTDQDVFFMHTSNDSGATQNRVVKMSFNGSSLSSRAVIVGGIRSSRFHNGGRIKFGPDGFLYVTTGEAQQPSLAQDRNSLNGKILRITKTGAAAPGNPFGTRIYSYGHRNPQGIAWDSAGRLWSSELGASSADELNLLLPGRNYGWPTCEGTCTVTGMENPKRTFSVSTCSPSGIAIVNDTVYMGALRGQRLWRIELNGTSAGATSTYFVSTYGRLRAVEKVPGVDAVWFGTSNEDNNGNGNPDVIRRSNIQ